MTPAAERRLLQAAVAIACCVPIAAGAAGVLLGPAWMGHPPRIPVDLDSHVRYLSGIFLGVGMAFTTCIPAIERQGPRFRLLAALVVAGGFARLGSLIAVGAPSRGHRIGLFLELVLVPLLVLWQARLASRYRISPAPAPAAARSQSRS
ncbi:DUF4345 domain-containing protein [uncultured Sphingomonas sp.]|uniref:DUF4345 domain-containing protein n=1 Tax=uncultured Sphingomonas sp. TaxID=158754 RepID=UPI00261BD6EA|nr:DUF4345 domain-containing protein [uncultured Sphingomonas sp.]